MNTKLIAILTSALAVSLSGVSADDKAGAKGKGKGGPGQAEPDSRASVIFGLIDANDDGEITPKELAESRRFQDASKKEVGEAFKEKDLNGDGGISAHEFAKAFGPGDDVRGRHPGKGGPDKGKGRGPGKGKGKG